MHSPMNVKSVNSVCVCVCMCVRACTRPFTFQCWEWRYSLKLWTWTHFILVPANKGSDQNMKANQCV